jgi:hypothetical protein
VDHVTRAGNMVPLGSGASREVESYHLSRSMDRESRARVSSTANLAQHAGAP